MSKWVPKTKIFRSLFSCIPNQDEKQSLYSIQMHYKTAVIWNLISKSLKIVVLKNFAKFTGKHLAGVSYLIKLQAFNL